MSRLTLVELIVHIFVCARARPWFPPARKNSLHRHQAGPPICMDGGQEKSRSQLAAGKPRYFSMSLLETPRLSMTSRYVRFDAFFLRPMSDTLFLYCCQASTTVCNLFEKKENLAPL